MLLQQWLQHLLSVLEPLAAQQPPSFDITCGLQPIMLCCLVPLIIVSKCLDDLHWLELPHLFLAVEFGKSIIKPFLHMCGPPYEVTGAPTKCGFPLTGKSLCWNCECAPSMEDCTYCLFWWNKGTQELIFFRCSKWVHTETKREITCLTPWASLSSHQNSHASREEQPCSHPAWDTASQAISRMLDLRTCRGACIILMG